MSRIAGLLREVIAAAIFGTQGAINAFVIAFAVPNLLRSLVADSALSAAFLPVFTELEEQGREREARRLAGAMVGVISVGLGLVSLLAVLTAPWVMPLFAPGLSPELVDETVRLAQIMFPIVVLLGLTGLASALLQAADRFGPTAFVPVLWNMVIIVLLAPVSRRRSVTRVSDRSKSASFAPTFRSREIGMVPFNPNDQFSADPRLHIHAFGQPCSGTRSFTSSASPSRRAR